ncbi:hypothetical protein AMS59_13805 [Lysinibacillus sp. FJAT-14745]|uniref:restriction endonuclease subunit S n=1 Tax=Lysinibacillus sp. FJAT-14745 TaxID=1704289 RepID=UPI0006ABCE2D|nr:restriction endonuclease subunit S [Lysinibacillus sp. FJAT-14745]KOP78166.1 hypothetical protein AMS59_13805 [Lysinibacillus sp. FJAT-14745]
MSEVRQGYKMTELGEIPKEWELRKIDELCKILDSERKPLSKAERTLIRGEIPYYGANGIVDRINDYIFDEKLILLAEDGGHFHEYRNKPIAYKIEGKSWVNNHAHVLLPIESKSYDWIFYNLVHKNILNYINGGTRSKLNQSELKIISIPYPSIEEQETISSILSIVDEQIDETEQLIEKTKELKKGLMYQLLTKGIGYTEFKHTELGEIPKSWEVVLIDEVAERKSGHTPNKKNNEYWNGNIPWISLKDTFRLDKQYVEETTDYTTEEGLKNSSAVLLPKNTVIVLRDASVGKIGITKFEMATSQHFINYICGPKLDYKFLYYYFIAQKKTFIREAIGSTIKTIGLGFFKELKIILPPLKEQQKIASILSAVDEQIEVYEKEKTKYGELKKALMQQLLTGQIRVKI